MDMLRTQHLADRLRTVHARREGRLVAAGADDGLGGRQLEVLASIARPVECHPPGPALADLLRHGVPLGQPDAERPPNLAARVSP
eukprot:3485525-Pyramimonas_sp.AAC.2